MVFGRTPIQPGSLEMEFDEKILTSSSEICAAAWPNSTMGRDLETLTNIRAQRRVLIGRDPSICGGAPSIRGTRISVARIVEMHHLLDWDIERIQEGYPHLSRDQIKAALECYEEHALEIDILLQNEKEIGAG